MNILVTDKAKDKIREILKEYKLITLKIEYSQPQLKGFENYCIDESNYTAVKVENFEIWVYNRNLWDLRNLVIDC